MNSKSNKIFGRLSIVASLLGLSLVTQAKIATDFRVSGIVEKEEIISQSISLNRNEESDGKIQVCPWVIKKGKKAVFEMTAMPPDASGNGWNNGNTYFCKAEDVSVKPAKVIAISSAVPVDTSHAQNVKKHSGTWLPATPAIWEVTANDADTPCLFKIVCGGHQWGAATGSMRVLIKVKYMH